MIVFHHQGISSGGGVVETMGKMGLVEVSETTSIVAGSLDVARTRSCTTCALLCCLDTSE